MRNKKENRENWNQFIIIVGFTSESLSEYKKIPERITFWERNDKYQEYQHHEIRENYDFFSERESSGMRL